MNRPATLTTSMTVGWLVVFGGVFIWSAIDHRDVTTWALEVAPAIIAQAVLAATARPFPLTPQVYLLILLHCVILMVGGHYTYAEVPAFDWIRDILDHQRNNYDKLGHLAQGFIPAMVAREILIRLQVINGRGWLNFLIICFCLAVSAFYELLEWWVALTSEQAADAFLGTQGYVWDTQSAMMYALIGAITALLVLSKLHDKQLANLRMVVQY